ncbi:MAG: toprim domain-containing protein [Candidatus Pedobacter colombiensis]|uniref:Toprim domain-containing protein n=1 Tax=Candidatus Pedobacter colombiensis TaxID=3121371 RepID=A0AAJ5W7G5_9SPHI|nr:toprim domain-containing protein [Pedobacter sp.]WEK17952.1 MAG: toprim domain-containing protein [Pedobacter sp.]
MEKEKQSISCSQARKIDIVNYLDSIGFQPHRIKGSDYWYHSPFRLEKTPSFKVNKELNRFYDFGEGWGGNLIDFGTHFYNCSVADFLKSLPNLSSFQKLVKPFQPIANVPSLKVNILCSAPITAPSLISYLSTRGISKDLALQFCEELHYKIGRKNYYGIGFKNDIGGYEIRNPYFKGSSSPKAITTIIKGNKKLSVFEGFFDFLSFVTLYQKIPSSHSDFLILNSLSFFEKSLEQMMAYEVVDLYLDNNTAGQHCTVKALAANKCFQDKSGLYKGYEDLNDFLLKKRIVSVQSDPSLKEPP